MWTLWRGLDRKWFVTVVYIVISFKYQWAQWCQFQNDVMCLQLWQDELQTGVTTCVDESLCCVGRHITCSIWNHMFLSRNREFVSWQNWHKSELILHELIASRQHDADKRLLNSYLQWVSLLCSRKFSSWRLGMARLFLFISSVGHSSFVLVDMRSHVRLRC